MRKLVAAAGCAVAIAGCGAPKALEELANGATSERATVSRAVDGDTMAVEVGGAEETVRLIGIDTPETVKPGAPVECGGPQASRSMKRLAHEGDAVELIEDPTQDTEDRYGRLLRYVEEDGRDLGKVQVRRGWAEVYVYGSVPFERVERYRGASAKAEAHGAGVFGLCGGNFDLPVSG